MFGHPVEFNFNRKGNTHNTPFGGFMSVIIKLLMAAYFYILLKRMVLHEADDIST